jgi:ATP-dependent Clp protease ATP-binding subunit ClpA
MSNAEHKNILPFSIFKTILIVEKRALDEGISLVDSCFFASCMMSANKMHFHPTFDDKEMGKFCAFIDENCLVRSKKKTFNIDDIKFAKPVIDCVVKAKVEPNNVDACHVFYLLMKSDRKLNSIAAQHNITTNKILEVVNRIGSSKIENDKKVTGKNKKPAKSVASGKEDLIFKYCIDFNEKAAKGELSPVFCRDDEIEKVIVSLMKKNKANPLLIGEPGVGKTAIVEGIAQKFAAGDVPKRFKGYKILGLSMSSIIQGTTLRGQFEERLEAIMKKIIETGNIILFIDEIHTMVGAGNDSNGLDAGNIMKPYLARGEFRCIGATTFDDYYKYMKKDKALSRRFQRIFVSEPSKEETIEIIRGLAPGLETYHGCVIDSSSFEKSVDLCQRFINDRFFPDKAIDCLDHACAKSSLDLSVVGDDIIEEVISDFCDIPVSLIRTKESVRLEKLEGAIGSEIFGNENSIKEFCNRIRFACSTRKSSSGPLCSFVFYGPPGIGKKSIIGITARHLYGDQSVIVINGSEYSESNAINRIIGSPPGYIGYDEEGYILREVRRKPHTMILIKKQDLMHATVKEQFKQIIERGVVTDVHGMIADFSNCVIAFSVDTSNKSSLGFTQGGNSVSGDAECETIKKNCPLLSRVSHHISFNDTPSEYVSSLVSVEMEKFHDELKFSEIRVHYDSKCIKYFESLKGSPSSIRSEVRNKLEYELCNGLSSDNREYWFEVVDDEITVRR